MNLKIKHLIAILSTSLLFATSLFSYAQDTPPIDSLKSVLEKRMGKQRVNLLNDISRAYWNINFDSSLVYAQKALKYSNKIRFDEGISNAYNRIGNVWYFRQQHDSALHYYQKALTLRKEMKKPSTVASIYNNIAILYLMKEQLTIALEFYHKAYKTSEDADNKEDMLRYATQLGAIYNENSNYSKSIEHYLHTLEIAKSLNDKEAQAITCQNIADIYKSINAYDNALDYNIRALKIFQSSNNVRGESSAYNNIGIIHQDLNNHDKAIEYFEKALVIDEKNNFTRNMSAVYNNMGIIYDKRGEKLKALEYYKKSLSYDDDENLQGKATALNNIGLIQHDLGNQEKALENLFNSHNISKDLKDQYAIANTSNNIAKVYIAENKFSLADTFLNRSLAIAQKIKSFPILEEAHKLLAELKEKEKNYKQALAHYENYIEVHDSIYKQRMNQNIAETQVKFETEAIEQENELLRKDNEIQKLAIQKQKVIKNVFIGFTALVLALLALIYSRFSLKKETTSLLKKKNQELEKTNKKLASSENNLKALNATKDKFFSIIAHDLKNPFQALLGFSEIIYSRAHDLTPEELEEYAKAINDSSQNLFNLLGNLLQWSRTQLGTTSINPEIINLEMGVKEVLETMSMAANEKNLAIQAHIPANLQVIADKNALMSILRNLISNAIKFTYPKGHVEIEAIPHKSEVQIRVIDTGKGITQEDLTKLFKIDSNFSTKGTANEQGTGLGLILSKELVNKCGGDIWAESEKGKGSIFTFTLPKPKVKK
jgi:signal transduction histidine kinase